MAILATTQTSAASSSWRNVARVMGQAGGASLASGLLSLVATKIIATAFGPVQVAVLATLQQLRTTATTCGSLAGQTALVQGASLSRGRERREFLRTVAALMGVATAIVLSIFLVFPQWVALQTGLAPTQSGLVAGLSVAIVLAVVYVFLSALLNATGAVRELAFVQLSAPVSMMLLAYLMARSASDHPAASFVFLLTTSSGIAILCAAWALRRKQETIRDWFHVEECWWNWSSARKFFMISGSMFASALFSSWALTIVRARVLHTQGLTTGGELDAAWSISMNQAGLMLASLQTFYLPALARISDPQQKSAHISRVLTVATISAAAFISLLIALKPIVLATLYSNAFSGAARYLRWTLAGDYLKITSWILSIPLLASAHMRSFLAADIAAYCAFVIAAFGLSSWMGAAESMSIAFVAMYAVHLLFCGTCLWLKREFRPTAQTSFLWFAGLGTVVVFSAAFWRQA